jgi:hypothetical protein
MPSLRNLLDWKRLLGLAVALGLLFLSFYKTNLRELWETLSRINPLLLLGALGSSVLMNWAKGMRWREIMMGVKKISKSRIFALFHVGQMINLSLPALTGQAARVVMLSKQENLSKTFGFTTVVMEVLFDGISLIILMYVSSFIFSFPPWVRKAEIYAALALAVLLLVLTLILRNQRALAYFGKTKIRRRFPRLYEHLHRISVSVSAGLHTLKSPVQILKVSAFSILVWVFHVGIAIMLVKAFDLNVPAWAGVVIIIINSVALMIPLTPGNIGSFQIAVIAALAMFRVPKSEAAAFSIVMHFMDIAPVFAIGIVVLFTNQLTFARLRQETISAAREREPAA